LAKQAQEIFNKALIDAPAQSVLAHIAGILKLTMCAGIWWADLCGTRCWAARRQISISLLKQMCRKSVRSWQIRCK